MNGARLIGKVTEIPQGEGRAFLVAGERIAVFHTRSGHVFATQAECPHLRGPLADGLVGGATVICPLHERSYDLRTGAGMNGECSKVRTYPIALDADGRIWLSTTG
jgi:nitrite reductase (NADH) small subunit